MAVFNQDIWREYYREKRSHDDVEYWDRRASNFADNSGISNYGKEFLELCELEKDWTALDMGCGSGSLTIELAKRVRHMTGIDFSPKMLELLGENASRLGVTNIDCINASWEDDWDDAGIPVVDLAVASRAMSTVDLPSALRKLDSRARQRVCITTVHGDLAFADRRVIESVGRTLPVPPDYIHVVDCLYDMGITAEVRFIRSVKRDRYKTLADARADMMMMLGSVSPEEDALLDEFIAQHVVREGDLWAKDYVRHNDWAFLSWNK